VPVAQLIADPDADPPAEPPLLGELLLSVPHAASATVAVSAMPARMPSR
jgi:hypothetical protein